MKITHVVLLFALCGHAGARLNSDDGVEQDQRSLEIENDGLIGANIAGLGYAFTSDTEPLSASLPAASMLPSGTFAGPPVSFEMFLAGYDNSLERKVLISSSSTDGQKKIEQGAIKVNFQPQLVKGQNFVTANAAQCKEWASDPECG
jgi:hypothetical protein